MKLIAGLGNPGRAYSRTRHNAGYQVLDHFSSHHRIRLFWPRFNSRLASGKVSQEKIILLKPRTYMNLSGNAVVPALKHYRLSGSDLIVIHDDLDLGMGTIRLARKGGDGGHRGLRSIIETLGSEEFIRVRVGIGRPKENIDVSDYVLMEPEDEELEDFEKSVKAASQALDMLISQGLEAAMNRVHRRA